MDLFCILLKVKKETGGKKEEAIGTNFFEVARHLGDSIQKSSCISSV